MESKQETGHWMHGFKLKCFGLSLRNVTAKNQSEDSMWQHWPMSVKNEGLMGWWPALGVGMWQNQQWWWHRLCSACGHMTPVSTHQLTPTQHCLLLEYPDDGMWWHFLVYVKLVETLYKAWAHFILKLHTRSAKKSSLSLLWIKI